MCEFQQAPRTATEFLERKLVMASIMELVSMHLRLSTVGRGKVKGRIHPKGRSPVQSGALLKLHLIDCGVGKRSAPWALSYETWGHRFIDNRAAYGARKI